MSIPECKFDTIRALNIDEHRVKCIYEYWEAEFPSQTYVGQHIAVIKQRLGSEFTRSDLVDFYRVSDIESETKFIAAMIWGHEAPLGSRRDSRGPWKLSRIFSRTSDAERAIRSVSLETSQDIAKAYKLLDKTLERCGPNVFTKHFYFLGKAQGKDPYPLIFDDRVARGLVKVAMSNYMNLGLVNISALRKPEAYLQYLSFAKREADRIMCSPDQIEYYLFNL